MREFVLVEFLVARDEEKNLCTKLDSLGEDFLYIKTEYEYEIDNDWYTETHWTRVTGKISSMYASIIKLQDPYLAEHMRISYIPEDLKDKYRR